MSLGIECPVCEAVFRVKQVSSKTGIRCPKCDRKFRYSEEILATPQPANQTSALADTKPAKPKTKKHATSAPAATKPAPPSKQSRKRKPKLVAASTATKPTQDNRESKPAASQSKVATVQHSTEALPSRPSEEIEVGENTSSKMTLIQDRKRQKARQQTSRAITSVVILSITIAVLGYFLYRQLNYTPPVEQTANNSNASASKKEPIDLAKLNPDPSKPQRRDLAGGQLENDTTDSDEPDEDDQPIELPRVSANDLPQRKFEFLQTKEMRTVWQRICLLYTSPSPRDS